MFVDASPVVLWAMIFQNNPGKEDGNIIDCASRGLFAVEHRHCVPKHSICNRVGNEVTSTCCYSSYVVIFIDQHQIVNQSSAIGFTPTSV